MSLFTSDILNLLVKKGLPFAVFSLPNSGQTSLIAQNSIELNKTHFENIEEITGFVIAEFESAETNIINYISPDFLFNQDEDLTELRSFLESIPDYDYPEIKGQTTFLSKIEYLGKTDYLIGKLKEKELDKIVISRISPMELETAIDINKYISNLIKKYPEAFVYLTNSAKTGLWTAATPETLIKKNKSFCETAALAGTQTLEGYSSKGFWDEKEKEEQQFVSRYIEKLLSELGCNDYEKHGPETIVAGGIVHLKTLFKIKTASLDGELGEFIQGLHPTPAVCGIPKAAAYQMIKNAETHPRELYTGFIGPWNLNKKSELFVNLRCAKILDDTILFYVGGGLTAMSDAKAEWQETVNKTKTLLSVIEKL